ncbi:MAG: hypothetical protein ACLQVN_24945 [Bryobacteraceae bacterium]
MVVIADTSPINYLILIDQIDLLARLYHRILIPPAVMAELKHPLAPRPVRDWAGDTPDWLEIVSPKSSLTLSHLDLVKARRLLLQLKYMQNCSSSMSWQDGRKPPAEG